MSLAQGKSRSRTGSQSNWRLPGRVWTVTAISFLANTADNFLLFVLFWIAAPQGWSGVQTALIVLVLRLPSLGSGILGGAAVDRFGGRRLVLIDVTTRSALMVVLAVSGWTGQLPLVAVLVVGAVSGTLSPTTYSGVRWLLPRYVEETGLPGANAVLAIGEQLPLLVGSAMVGPALAVLGPGPSLLIPAAMLAIASALAWGLPAPATLGDRGAGTTDGTDAPAKRLPARVLAVIALSTAYYLAYGPFETVTPALVRDQLHGAEYTYGLLWALFGIGALATLSLAPLLTRHRPGLVNAFGAIAWGVAMLPLAMVDDVPVAAALFLVGGAIWGPYSAVEATALHRWADPSRHGQVFGLQRSLLATATPLGAALGAIALDHADPGTILGVSALGCALAGLLALFSTELRRAS